MKRILLAIILLVISAFAFIYRDNILAFIMYVEEVNRNNLVLSISILVILKTLSAPLGFPGTPLTLLAGSLFGNILGTFVALIGNTLGASLAFLVSRYIFRDYVQTKIFPLYPKIAQYEQRLAQKAFSTIVALRLIPLFPFNALNFLLGVTQIHLKTYVVGSFLGMIPGTFIFVYFGESLRMFSPINIALAISGIIALTYVGKYYEKKF